MYRREKNKEALTSAFRVGAPGGPPGGKTMPPSKKCEVRVGKTNDNKIPRNR